jgi:hypothetical protein
MFFSSFYAELLLKCESEALKLVFEQVMEQRKLFCPISRKLIVNTLLLVHLKLWIKLWGRAHHQASSPITGHVSSFYYQLYYSSLHI